MTQRVLLGRGLGRGAALSLALLVSGVPCRAEDGVAAKPFAADRSITILEGTTEPAAPPADKPTEAPPLPRINPAPMPNAAGLKVEILPGTTLTLGARIALTVSTRRAGYLVVVDINADGQMLQIYPNMMSLSQSADAVSANHIEPGPATLIPNPKKPLARFILTADPPRGNGAIVAILSERPVQIIDLPESPANAQSTQALVDLLTRNVLELQIASADNPGKFVQGEWSFATVQYNIQ